MSVTSHDEAARYFELSRGLILNAKKRPILGGVFGVAGYEIGSQVGVQAGLHFVTYFVIEPRSQCVLGTACTQPDALDQARELIAKPKYEQFIAELVAARLAHEAAVKKDSFATSILKSAVRAVTKKIPRRRKHVFEKSGGRCHYCSTPLTLDGKWHVEHMMPKALLGGNEPGNLVAACTTCNLRKHDRTSEEFIHANRSAAQANCMNQAT